MRVLDRIRKYIEDGIRDGSLQPGTRLPTCHEFMEISEGSYTTVRNALAKLQSEGLILVRNGIGTFLAGGDTLTVRLHIFNKALSVENFTELVRKHRLEERLNIHLNILPTEKLDDPDYYHEILQKKQAVLTVYSESERLYHLPAVQLSAFPDYRQVVSDMQIQDEQIARLALPFSKTYFFMVANRRLFQKMGLSTDDISFTSGWWQTYLDACQKHGIHPVSQAWPPNTISRFSSLYGLLFAICNCKGKVSNDALPFFDTPAGRKFLDVVRSIYFYPVVPNPGSFFCGGSGICLYVGTWFSVQNHLLSRPDVSVDDPVVVPFCIQDCNIFPSGLMRMEAYWDNGFRQEDKNRVWELMKILLSREFQLDYSNKSGFLSPRRDIDVSEYSWNANHQWDAAIPGKEDIVFYEQNVFSPEVTAALTVLLEDFMSGDISKDRLLHRMDLKKSVKYVNQYR